MVIISAADYSKYNLKYPKTYTLNEPKTEYKLQNPEEKNPHKYHDKLFKQILSNQKEFAHLINKYTDYTEYAPNLDEAEIELYDKEFVTKSLSKTESDLIYKVKDKELYFILEQQTNNDIKMPIRIPNYSLKLIERVSKNIEGYPLICPIVLYTGKRKWNVPITITEKQKKYYNIPAQSYPPYNLIDVHNYTNEELIEDKSIISKAMLFEKLETKAEIEKTIKALMNKKMTEQEVEYVTIMLTYSNHINKEMDKEEIEKYKELIKKGGKTMVTNFEKLFVELVNEKAKLRREAQAEGRTAGRIEIAKNLLNMKFNIKDIEKATGLTEKEIMKLKAV